MRSTGTAEYVTFPFLFVCFRAFLACKSLKVNKSIPVLSFDVSADPHHFHGPTYLYSPSLSWSFGHLNRYYF